MQNLLYLVVKYFDKRWGRLMPTVRSSLFTTSLASVQWLLFIFVNTVVVPLSIGLAFDVDADLIAGMLRSSLLFTGVACFLQGWIGHRFPLMEGQSGVMWAVMLNVCLSASTLGMSLTEIGGGVATGMLLAGAFTVLLSLFNLLDFMKRLFTPMVMSVYLFLLTFQLIFIFFEGMLKIRPDGTMDVPITLFSLGVAAFVGLLVVKGGKFLGNFSILIGMVLGWIGYRLLFPSTEVTEVSTSFQLPLFPLGVPNLNIGIILITFVASFVNLSNTIAAVQAAADLLKEHIQQLQYKRSYILTGLYSIGSGVLGLVSYAPFASSIGFLESTRIMTRKPFLIGGGLMAVIGVIPVLGGLLAKMPITVGYAVLFVAYMQLMGTSVRSLSGVTFNPKTIFRFATPVLLGVCLMNVDSTLFASLPVIVQPLVSNGFVVGVILSIVLEKTVKWGAYEGEGQGS